MEREADEATIIIIIYDGPERAKQDRPSLEGLHDALRAPADIPVLFSKGTHHKALVPVHNRQDSHLLSKQVPKMESQELSGPVAPHKATIERQEGGKQRANKKRGGRVERGSQGNY